MSKGCFSYMLIHYLKKILAREFLAKTYISTNIIQLNYFLKKHKLYTTTTSKCSICSMSSITKQRITLFINPSIVTHARAQAIVEKLTLTALIEKALLNYLPKETIIKKIDVIEPVVRQ